MEPRTKLIIAMLLVAFGSGAQAIVAWTDGRVTFAAITTAIARRSCRGGIAAPGRSDVARNLTCREAAIVDEYLESRARRCRSRTVGQMLVTARDQGDRRWSTFRDIALLRDAKSGRDQLRSQPY